MGEKVPEVLFPKKRSGPARLIRVVVKLALLVSLSHRQLMYGGKVFRHG